MVLPICVRHRSTQCWKFNSTALFSHSLYSRLPTSLLYLPIPSSAETYKIFTNMLSFFFRLSWQFKREKAAFWKASFLQHKKWLRVQDWVQTSQLVRISVLISARVLRFFSEKLIYKSNRQLFSCICMALCEHERGWIILDSYAKPRLRLGLTKLSRILPTPLVFISGNANTESVFYCLNVASVWTGL